MRRTDTRKHRSHVLEARLAVQRRGAFTLVELSIVLLILAIIGSIATPTYFRSLQHHRIHASAQRIAADLRLAQQQAKDTGTTVTVSFNVSDDEYTTPPVNGLPAGVASRTRVELARDPYRCDLATANFDNRPWISFDRFGLPQAGGMVKLQLGKHNLIVSVAANSGDVTID